MEFAYYETILEYVYEQYDPNTGARSILNAIEMIIDDVAEEQSKLSGQGKHRLVLSWDRSKPSYTIDRVPVAGT